MMSPAEVLRIAAVQAAPVFLDAEKTLEKAVRLIEEAAGRGARLVAFGEGFLPAHPIWLHVHPVTSPRQIELASALVAVAIRIPGPAAIRLGEVARATSTTVVLGAVERLTDTNSSLALAALVATPDGVVTARRKIVPAVGERVLFTPGDGDAIRVFDTPFGPLSVLLGGENANPLLTWTMREMGARVHVAAWPPHFNKPGVMAEVATITGRAIAYQNTAYVISVTGATTPEIRERLAGSEDDRALLERMASDPGSAVYAPRGALMAGPLEGGEGVLYADLDLSAGAWAGLVNRHYDRPDLLRVTVDRSVRSEALFVRDTHEPGDLEARARRLIDDRYGHALGADDRARLVPFVVSILDTSAMLEALEPSTMDPTTMPFADDLRAGT